MNKFDRDECVIVVLIQRLCESRIHRALRLQLKVDDGETLSSSDIRFLARGHKNTQQIIHLVDKHPKHQNLFRDIIHLYHHITLRALDNEQKSASPEIFP